MANATLYTFSDERINLDNKFKDQASKDAMLSLLKESGEFGEIPAGYEDFLCQIAEGQLRNSKIGKANSIFESQVAPNYTYPTPGVLANQGVPKAASFGGNQYTPSSQLNGTAGSADIFPALFPVAIKAIRRTNFLDFIGPKALFTMNSNSGIMYFIDAKYSNGKLDGAVPPTLVSATNINKLTATTDTNDASTLDPTTVGQLAIGSYVGLFHSTVDAPTQADGSFTITAVNAGKNSELARFLISGYNPITGSLILQVAYINTGTTVAAYNSLSEMFVNGNKLYFYGTNVNSAVGAVTVESTTTLTATTGVLGDVSAIDAVSRGYTCIDANDTNKPSWFTGYTPSAVATGTFGTTAAPTATKGLTRPSLENNVPNHAALTMKQYQVDSTGFQVKTDLSLVQNQDYSKMFNLNTVEMLKGLMGSLVDQDINMGGIQMLDYLSGTAATTCDNIEGTKLLTGSAFVTLSNAGTAETTSSIQRKMITVLQKVAQLQGWRNRSYKAADKLMASPTIIAALNDNKEYVVNPAKMIAEEGTDIVQGKIGKTEMHARQDTNWVGNNDIIFGQTATDVSSNGLKFGTYIAAALQEATDPNTMALVMQLTSRVAFVEAGWYPQNAYLKFKVNSADIAAISGSDIV